MGFFDIFSSKKKEKLDSGLAKTKESVFTKISRAIAGKSKVDEEVLDNLEEVLITSDVGVDTTLEIIRRIEERVARDKYVSTSELNNILREEIAALLTENNTDDTEGFNLPTDHKPYIMKNHDDWQIGISIQEGRKASGAGSCRHLPCSRSGAVVHLGRTRGSSCREATDGK